MRRHTSWILIPVVLTYGCSHSGVQRLDPANVRTEYVDRLKPVATPCEERVRGFEDALLDPNKAITPGAEGKVEALTRSDADLREFTKRLMASARRCGVVIE